MKIKKERQERAHKLTKWDGYKENEVAECSCGKKFEGRKALSLFTAHRNNADKETQGSPLNRKQKRKMGIRSTTRSNGQ